MHDVTRIPRVLRAVQDVWEGQPDLSFGALVGMLENFGLNWAADDEEAVAVCAAVAALHPARVPLDDSARATGVYQVVLFDSRNRVFLDEQRVLVVPADGAPSCWAYASIRNAQVGYPLLIDDGQGGTHRLGVIDHLVPRARATSFGSEETVFHDNGEWKVLSLSGRVQAWEVGRRQAKQTRIDRNGADYDARGRLASFVANGERVVLGDGTLVFACGLELGENDSIN